MTLLNGLLLCGCANPTEGVGTITDDSCRTNFGATFRLLFQRKRAIDGTVNSIAEGDMVTDTVFQGLTALTDAGAGRIQCSPELDNPQSEAGAKKSYGGGDLLRDSKSISLGSEVSKITFDLVKVSQEIVAQLKAYTCDADNNNLAVYLVNGEGNIAGVSDGTDVTGFPVSSLFVSDLKLGNNSTPDMNTLEIEFSSNWSDGFKAFPSTFGLELINVAIA